MLPRQNNVEKWSTHIHIYALPVWGHGLVLNIEVPVLSVQSQKRGIAIVEVAIVVA